MNYLIYVQRKMRIGTIPELYLRIVRILTLSADSGIVPDNSRIAQGVFYRFCYNQALRKVGMGWTKSELGEHAWESLFNFDRLQRGVFSFSNLNISDGSHFKHITFCLHCLHVLHYRNYPVCDYERERERLIRVSLNMYQIRQY